MRGRHPRGTLVTFELGEGWYAFDVADVVEVARPGPLTPLPGTSDCLAGVVAWRGRTIPVLELGALLKLEGASPDVKRKLIVLGRPSPFGVLVDRPGDLLDPTGTEDVEMPAGRPTDGIGKTLTIVRAELGLVRVLDPEGILEASPELLPQRVEE